MSIFIRDYYNSRVLDDISLSLDHVESIFVKGTYKGKVVVVGCIYRPPHGDITLFFKVWKTFLITCLVFRI